jgi:hypothetical protein
MLKNRRFRFIPLVLLASLLAACSSASSGAPPVPPGVLSPPVESASEEAAAGAYAPSAPALPVTAQEPDQPAPASPSWDTQNDTQNDSQGPIDVAITPLNLDVPGETLDFEVVLDTHSVDLGMDLAPLASLQTDAGLAAPALLWDAPLGGHHVSGILSFPAALDGVSLLESAAEIQIVISDLEAPQRIFTWQRR